MMVDSLHPGIDLARVQAETGFESIVPSEIGHTEAPTEEELRILRAEVDPSGC